MRKKKPISTGVKVFLILIVVAAVGVIGLSVYKLTGISRSYQQANNLYEDIASLAMGIEEPASPSGAGAENPTGSAKPQETKNTPEEEPFGQASLQETTEAAGQTDGFKPEEESRVSQEAPAGQTAPEEQTAAVQESSVVSQVFTDETLYVIGGHYRADAQRLQRYASSYKNSKKAYTSFPGVGRASIPWNFKALHDKYPDAVGWIFQKDKMSYPIVQGKDNNQYLRHMINGEYNIAGSLMVDYLFHKALDSRYSIVFGHNMDDDSMFGSLTDYTDEAYYREHPTMEIYSKERMYRYHVYAAMKVDVDSDLLLAEDDLTDEEFLKLMEQVDEEKLYATKAPKVTKDSHVVVLATCIDYPRDYSYRYIVVLVRENPLAPFQKPIDTIGE